MVSNACHDDSALLSGKNCYHCASGVVQKLANKPSIKRLADAGLDIHGQGQPPAINPAAVTVAAADEAAAEPEAAPEAAAAAPAAPPATMDPPAEAQAAPEKAAPALAGKEKKGAGH